VVNEMKKQLKRKGIIKIKMLKPFVSEMGKEKAVKMIADLTDSEVVQKVGFVVVLAGKKEKTFK
jgi:RNA-binding protein YhbY